MLMEFNLIILAQATCFLVIMMSSEAQPAIEFPIAKPGCAESCGNVSIPFPFGTTEECSLNLEFLIDCRNTYDIDGGGFTPFLLNEGRNVSIFNISVENGQLKVLHQVVAATCDSLETTLDRMIIIPFTVSSTSNLVFVTGCGNYGFFQGEEFSPQFKSTSFGCIPFCDNNFKVENTSCSDGYGCCQTTVPSELISYLTSSLNRLERQFNSTTPSCSYSFIADKSVFDANILRSKDSISASSKFPMVLNWSIKSNGNQSCGETLSRNLSNYACKKGSSCQYIGVDRYRCACLPGYEGNPYLGGCTDIDECGRLDHGCVQSCVNIQGGFTCRCGVGYLGDGRTNGTGCIPIKKSIVLVAVGGMTLGISLLLAASYLLYKMIRKRRDKNRRNRFFKKNGGQLLDQLSTNGNNIEKVHIFTAKELDKVTDHFNENRVLGRGGQGTVYKGMLSDGKIIAVKKSKLDDAGQVEQFINEVVILSYIDHRNVVKLLGCCLETEVPLLVYEFIPNGTLDDLIHNNDEGDDFLLSWEVRLRISKEVARALSYLHSTTSIPVYHRDVKSSNILLDEKYRAKLSDFGISRHISIEQTHLSTLVKGTFGYLDPEYFQSSQFTDKSDVYSFGVVLVELLTGRKAISSFGVDEECRVSLATKFLQTMEENCLNTILDARVLEGARVEEIDVVANLAQNCLNLDGRKRPTMTQVAMKLEDIFQVSSLPSIAGSNFQAGTLELPIGASVYATSSSIDELPLLSDTF